MNRTILWQTAALQAVAVAAISVLLALALPRSFFEDWGWIAGPAAWLACATLTAEILRLPVALALVGASLAGLASLAAVLVGVHWLGAAVAVVLFAVWCGRLTRPEVAWTSS